MATSDEYALIRIGELGVRFLLESADTGGAMAMYEFVVPAGAKTPPPQAHEDFDVTVYGLAGVLTMNIDGRTFDLSAGESCFIGRGTMHGVRNLQAQEAKALAVITPAKVGLAYFKEIAAVVAAGGSPKVEAMKAVMVKHGLAPATPLTGRC